MTDGTTPQTPARPTSHRTWNDVILGLLLIAVMAAELLARMTDAPAVQVAAWLAMAATTIAAARRLGLREAYLLTVCAVLALLVWWLRPDATAELAGAMSQASFLMAFVLLLGLLHEAAATSPSIDALGRYLSRQPAGRRFYALFAGTGIMAVLFNLGVVSFLVPLIQRGIRSSAPDDPLNPIRERRQVSALLRGFAWCVIWSPTAIAPLALMELIPGVDRKLWILLGLVIFVIYMILGATEDAYRFRSYRPRAKQVQPEFPGHATLMFIAACGWLFVLSIIVSHIFDETIIFGLMAVCPVMLVGWIVVQNHSRGHTAWRAIGSRLDQIALTNLPHSARVAVTLACSGFIGRAAASLVPAQAVAEQLRLDAVPDFLLLSCIPPAIAAMSLLGLSPIMTAVFFGSFFGSLAVMPADPTLIALSIAMGWSLSMFLSPFATVVLMTNRVGGYPTKVLTWHWNLAYGAISIVVSVPIFALLAAVIHT